MFIKYLHEQLMIFINAVTRKYKNVIIFCIFFTAMVTCIFSNCLNFENNYSSDNGELKSENLFVISKYVNEGTKYGYINQAGKTILDTQFDVIGDFSEGVGFIKNSEKSWELIDKYGNRRKIIKSAILSSSDYFSEDFLQIEVAGKYGYIDKTGKIIIEPQFEYAGNFSEGLASIKINGKIGYIDKNGNIIIPPKFDKGYAFSEGLAAIKIGDRWGYVNKIGAVVIKPLFDSVQSFSEGLAAVKCEKNNISKFGYINKNGIIVLDCIYFNALDFHEKLAPVCDSSGCGYINKYGQKKISLSKNIIVDKFSDGLALIKIKNKYIYINKQGKKAISLEFDDATEFKHGLASVVIKKIPICKNGYIDKTGKFIWSQTSFAL